MESIFDRLKDVTMPTPTEAKRGLKRNVNAGHNYERACRDLFVALGYPHLTTTRAESQGRDQQKVDLMNKDEHINGRFEYNIQCKSIAGIVNYHNIFAGHETTVLIKKGPNAGSKIKKQIPAMDSLDGVMNVILHKYTEKEVEIHSTKNGPKEVVIFNPKAYYAIMKKKDFLLLVAMRKELSILTEENKELKAKIRDLQFLINNPDNGNSY